MTTIDTLRHLEATTRSQKLSKEEKRRYLRQRGWTKVRSGGTQTWVDSGGKSATLHGAVVLQLERDLAAH